MKEVKDLRNIIDKQDNHDTLVLLLEKPSGHEILDIHNVSVRQTGQNQEVTIILRSRHDY